MPTPLVAVLAALSVVVFYFALIWVLSRLTGWATLAREYTVDKEPEGDRRSWEGIRLRRFGYYNSCVVMVLSPGGLYLRVFRPFAFGHRPLLIPWERIHHVKDGKIVGQAATFLEIEARDARVALVLDRAAWEAGEAHRKPRS